MSQIKVPPLGESIVEATVSRWLKKEGEAIAAGDTLVELETDKITVEVPALSKGVLTKRLHAEGDVVKVDDVLGEIDENASAVAAPTSAPAPAQAAASTPPPAAAAGAPATARQGAPASEVSSEVRASPAAKRMAAEQGVDLGSVRGTGRGGVVSKPDVVEQTGEREAGGNAPGRAESVVGSGAQGSTPVVGGPPARRHPPHRRRRTAHARRARK